VEPPKRQKINDGLTASQRHYRKYPNKRYIRHLKEAYGLTEEQYLGLVANQGGLCAICSNAPKNRKLDIDHCHTTNRIRGLLCNKCNQAIGLLNDSPKLAVKVALYLLEGGQSIPRGTPK
jgi:hypothetical protein